MAIQQTGPYNPNPPMDIPVTGGQNNHTTNPVVTPLPRSMDNPIPTPVKVSPGNPTGPYDPRQDLARPEPGFMAPRPGAPQGPAPANRPWLNMPYDVRRKYRMGRMDPSQKREMYQRWMYNQTPAGSGPQTTFPSGPQVPGGQPTHAGGLPSGKWPGSLPPGGTSYPGPQRPGVFDQRDPAMLQQTGYYNPQKWYNQYQLQHMNSPWGRNRAQTQYNSFLKGM